MLALTLKVWSILKIDQINSTPIRELQILCDTGMPVRRVRNGNIGNDRTATTKAASM